MAHTWFAPVGRQAQLLQIMGPIDGMESAVAQYEALAFQQSGSRLVPPSATCHGPAGLAALHAVLRARLSCAGPVHPEGGDTAAEDQGQSSGAAGPGAAAAAATAGAAGPVSTGRFSVDAWRPAVFLTSAVHPSTFKPWLFTDLLQVQAPPGYPSAMPAAPQRTHYPPQYQQQQQHRQPSPLPPRHPSPLVPFSLAFPRLHHIWKGGQGCGQATDTAPLVHADAGGTPDGALA